MPMLSPDTRSPDEILHDKFSRVLGLLEELNVSFCLYQNDRLETFLRNSHSPPRPKSGGGDRPVAGSKIINKFAAETMTDIYTTELKEFGKDFTVDDADLANPDVMAQYSSSHPHERIRHRCPQLYTTLRALTGDTAEEEEDLSDEEEGPSPPPQKHTHFGIVIQVASMAYRFNQRHNALQKYLSVYMQAQHLSKVFLITASWNRNELHMDTSRY